MGELQILLNDLESMEPSFVFSEAGERLHKLLLESSNVEHFKDFHESTFRHVFNVMNDARQNRIGPNILFLNLISEIPASSSSNIDFI